MSLSIGFWSSYIGKEVRLLQQSEDSIGSGHILKFSFDVDCRNLMAVVQGNKSEMTYCVNVRLSQMGHYNEASGDNTLEDFYTIPEASCNCQNGGSKCHHVAAALLYGFVATSSSLNTQNGSTIKASNDISAVIVPSPQMILEMMDEMYPLNSYRVPSQETLLVNGNVTAVEQITVKTHGKRENADPSDVLDVSVVHSGISDETERPLSDSGNLKTIEVAEGSVEKMPVDFGNLRGTYVSSGNMEETVLDNTSVIDDNDDDNRNESSGRTDDEDDTGSNGSDYTGISETRGRDEVDQSSDGPANYDTKTRSKSNDLGDYNEKFTKLRDEFHEKHGRCVVKLNRIHAGVRGTDDDFGNLEKTEADDDSDKNESSGGSDEEDTGVHCTDDESSNSANTEMDDDWNKSRGGSDEEDTGSDGTDCTDIYEMETLKQSHDFESREDKTVMEQKTKLKQMDFEVRADKTIMEQKTKLKQMGKCDLCDKTMRKSSVRRHLRWHAAQKKGTHDHSRAQVLECKQCGEHFSTRSLLNDHIHSRKCEVCGKVLSRVTYMNIHLKMHKGENRVKCDICGILLCEGAIKYHLMVHAGKKEFECEVCGKHFGRRSLLNTHILGHSGKKDVQCPMCPKRFTIDRYMKIHLKGVHGTKDFVTCHICGKVITSRSMKPHLQNHTGEKKHKCKKCGNCFRNANQLECHEVVHTGNSHICEKCGKSFASFERLKQHHVVHTNQKDHVCDVCGKKFRWSNNLIDHKLSHNKVKAHKCVICEQTFTLPHHLRNHLKKHSAEDRHLNDLP